MNWDKLKTALTNNLAPSLRNRVDFHSTFYQKSSDNPSVYDGYARITIDGEDFVTFSATDAFRRFGANFHASTPTECQRHPRVENCKRTQGLLFEEGEFSKQDFHVCCEKYLQLSANAALEAPSPIIQMFALFDKRLGKKKIASLDEKLLHPLPRAVLQLRKKFDHLS